MSPSLPEVSSRGPATTIEVDQRREDVFEVLTDPRTYPDWLVGADAIREVEPNWPEPGSSFHHVVGAGPFKLADKSTVVAVDKPRRLELAVFARPFIKAHVTFELSERNGGGTRIEMREKPERGVAAWMWNCLGRFGVAASLWGRNTTSLERLRGYLEERPDVTP
jgi:uncharacterized protein YndB with AHSA1/START domain